MKLKFTKYRTLSGLKEVAEIIGDSYGQYIIYQKKNPNFYINCFDFKEESNQVLNGLLLSRRKSISEVLANINKNHDIKLSVKKAPLLGIKVSSEIREIQLKVLPLKWLQS